MWGTPERLEQMNKVARKSNCKQRKKPGHQKMMREYFQGYNKRPYQKAKQAEYYSSPEVRARLRKEYADNPRRLIEARDRARKKAASETRKSSPEFIAREKRLAKERYERDKPIIFAKINERRRSDPAMRLKQNVSRRIRKAMLATDCLKDAATVEILGCAIPDFRAWLERQFEPGMTWENYGTRGWNIDHILPIARFPLDESVALRHAFNYRNCRPCGAYRISKRVTHSTWRW